MNDPELDKPYMVTVDGVHWFLASMQRWDDYDGYCLAWTAIDADYPASWTGGVCWDENEDSVMSEQVIAWEEI